MLYISKFELKIWKKRKMQYIWTCRASAIHEIPINWRYVHKRWPALVLMQQSTWDEGDRGIANIALLCLFLVAQMMATKGNLMFFFRNDFHFHQLKVVLPNLWYFSQLKISTSPGTYLKGGWWFKWKYSYEKDKEQRSNQSIQCDYICILSNKQVE